jgi:predicted esterase
LVNALGLAAHLDEYKARAFVVGPSNGTAYAPADLTAFQDLLRTRRSANLKVIGVGSGATFVNNVISKYAFAVAGILTYGGTVDKDVVSSIPVPAYVHGTDRTVAQLYIAANGATVKVESLAFTTYTNPGPHEALQRVVVSKRPDARETLAQAFDNAWKTVFSKNYRLYMTQTESYSQGFDPNNHTEPWELEPYVMYDELGVGYETVTEELPGIGLSLRYEYVPRRAVGAAPKSVPLVVILHGNNNDPRIQGESSGWVETAAKHTIMLTSIEWQGRTMQETTFAAIGEAGTMAILDRLLTKYPQIDPTRVYFTGLSAGAMNSFSYGMNNLQRIAGVAGHSAPFGPPPLLDAALKAKAIGQYLPMYAIAGTRDIVQTAARQSDAALVLQRDSRVCAVERHFGARQPRPCGQRDVRAEAQWTWLGRARRPPRHGRNAVKPIGRHDQTGRPRSVWTLELQTGCGRHVGVSLQVPSECDDR